MDIREYVAENGIAVEIERDRGAQVDADGWEHHAYVLRMTDKHGHTMSGLPWKQGYGIAESPTEAPWNVLDAMASDAASFLDADGFEDWADGLGYDTDSRKAEKSYRACGEIADKLTDFLGGEEQRGVLLHEVERL